MDGFRNQVVSSTSWQSVGFVYGVAVALSLSVTHLVSAAELMVNFDGILSADIVKIHHQLSSGY